MAGWNYPQSNAQAGPSKSSNTAVDRSHQSTNVTYTHWSQQHLEANPDAGFELFAGLMHMSGSSDAPPLIPRSAFRNNNHGEIRPADSTYSVLSSSTRNTDYTLGTPYSTISSSSSSAYPVANTVPDIPLTSWMLPPENKDHATLTGSSSYRNGLSTTSNQHGPSRMHPSRSSSDHTGTTTHLPSALKQTTSSGSINTVHAFAPVPSSSGFRVPTQQNIPTAEHIRRDGHLPATLYPHSRFGFEEGEIIDEARFADQPTARKINAVQRSPNVWDFPRSQTTLDNHQFAKPYTLAQNQGKGKGKQVGTPYAANGAHPTTRWGESSGSSDDDDEAETHDGYMRNCEPMIKNDKRKFKSMNLLGSSPAPRQTSAAPSQSEQEGTSQNTKRRRDKSATSEGSTYGPTATGRLASTQESQNDFDSEGITDQPCKPGERQRMAFIELPRPFKRNPKRREAYVFLDIPPLPTKSLRKAAIAARERTIGGVLTGFESLDEKEEEEMEESEESEEEPEVVIEGDKFLTADEEKDALRDTCHQCQEVSKEAKMSCCNTEVECSLRYCKTCVEERYDFYFDAESRLFICPVCQGYCNCAPCLDKSKLMDKLHLPEIMDGTPEEFRRILHKYKNVQTFLEAMGASKAPPVPKTIIHKIRIVRKAEDTLSRPIPQDVYHQLLQPQKMEVTYRSMISLAGPITWAFPKPSVNKKRKHRKAVVPEGDFEEEGAAEDSDSDFDERRERKRAKTNKKKTKQSSSHTNPPPPVTPFQFALDPTGEILYGNDGFPVINPVASPQSKFSPTKRNGKKQVTFSTEVEAPFNEPQYGTLDLQARPRGLAAEAVQQAVQYLANQLNQQRQHSADPDSNPDFRLDPILENFLNEDAESGQLARQLLEDGELPEDEPIPQSEEQQSHLLANLHALDPSVLAARANTPQQDGPSAQQSATIEPMEEAQNADSFSLNLEDNTFDSLVARVQHFQNGPEDSELDAIFDVFTHNGTDEGLDNRAYEGGNGGSDGPSFDLSIENVASTAGEV